jgi:resuscitation-promoting factor RpfB
MSPDESLVNSLTGELDFFVVAHRSVCQISHPRILIALLLVIILFFNGCTSPQATQALIQVIITADGQSFTLQMPAGSTVQQTLDKAKLSLNALDRTEPAVYTVLGDKSQVRLVRVTEEFDVEQVVIPYAQQTLRNESLPVEKEVLIQKGKEGLQEVTYRRLYEDGVQISKEPIPVKSVVVQEPVPEIRMIGVQTPFAPAPIPGKIYYLRDGNLWVLEGNTANRKAVLTLGDLDGRILTISEDGSYVLFTRHSQEKDQINQLWAAQIGPESGSQAAVKPTLAPGEFPTEQEPVDLKARNVIHFADFFPGSNNKVVFSTVEPREAAPGWQANNDLNELTFSDNGWTTKWTEVLEANSGGVYGWWGMNFLWTPEGRSLAYARPDGIGIVDYKTGSMTNTLNIVPLQTHSDWAWIPGLTWGPDGNSQYTVDHVAQQGATNPEESTAFDLTAVLFGGGPILHLVSQTGMFAYPLASPLQNTAEAGLDYQLAFLQAIFPDQSETSRYRVTVMDRDGSNRRAIFPPEEAPGMEPQQHWGVWSPAPVPAREGSTTGGPGYVLAVIYQGNMWLVNVDNGDAVQVTGDGLTTRLIWR